MGDAPQGRDRGGGGGERSAAATRVLLVVANGGASAVPSLLDDAALVRGRNSKVEFCVTEQVRWRLSLGLLGKERWIERVTWRGGESTDTDFPPQKRPAGALGMPAPAASVEPHPGRGRLRG